MVKSCRERMLAAINLEQPRLVPITDLTIEPRIVEALTGERTLGYWYGGYRSGGAGETLDAREISLRNMRAMVRCCRKLGFDAVNVSDYVLHEKGVNLRFLDAQTYQDVWGRIYRVRDDTRTSWWIDGAIRTPEDLDRWEPPDPYAPGRMDLLEEVVKSVGEEMVVMGFGHGAFQVTWQMRGGMDKFIRDLYAEPGFAKRFMDKVAEANLEWERAMLEMGIDIFGDGDDLADMRGPFLGPGMFKEHVMPYFEREVHEARRRGVAFLKHTDGNIAPILDLFLEAGISGLHPMEPGAMEIGDVKAKYGDRIFVMGNVDCKHVLPLMDEQGVRRDVRRVIDAASPGGGHVLASSNSLHSNVKPENVLTMVDEARRYGRYPLIGKPHG
ncbi:MAG: uroporphyrinogen decarboxylase family protein [Candidatus Bathyarchaeia archaeon]